MQNLTQKPYKILRKQSLSPRKSEWYTPGCVPANTETLFVDLETSGLNPYVKDSQIITIGISCEAGSFYEHITGYHFEELKNELSGRRLIAFNTAFDAGWADKLWPELELNWVSCALTFFKLLSTEAFIGQNWQLDTAIRDVLGWPESQKATIKELLAEQGLRKDQMHILSVTNPKEFGEYCADDAEAARQLWNYLTEVCKRPEFDTVPVWRDQEFQNQINLLRETQKRGLFIDRPGMVRYLKDLQVRQSVAVASFFEHPSVRPALEEYNQNVLDTYTHLQPEKYTKTNKVSARWKKWEEKCRDIESKEQFNINSKQQLAWLFYDKVFKTSIRHKEPGSNQGTLFVEAEGHTREFKLTPSGGRPVGKKQLQLLGEPGKLLFNYNKLLKEEGYVKACLEKTEYDGLLHPQIKVHGTVTGRPGGSSGFNILQQPKVRGYLECWKARPGHVLLQLDFAALEPVILTNATKDKTLVKLYANPDQPNDVYLFNAAHFSMFKDEVRKYFDPDNPTAEQISLAKKKCKGTRYTNKVVHLAKQYRATPWGILYTLRDADVTVPDGRGGLRPVEIEDAQKVSADWDKLYDGTLKFEQQLVAEWKKRGGWFYNLFGRPVALSNEKAFNKKEEPKDFLNQYAQSSGHDALLKYLCHVQMLREYYDVPLYPWIPDYYDEVIFEVPKEDTERGIRILIRALELLNEELAPFLPVCKLLGEPEVVHNLAEVKCED